MSTRGCIARVTGDGWAGVYQHSDSYPTWLGKELWANLHGKYKGDINLFLHQAIDAHPGGWSSYPDVCYCHSHFAKRDGSIDKNSPYYRKGAPDGRMTSRTADCLFIEWVYAFDPVHSMMSVFYNTVTKKLVGGQHGTLIRTSRLLRLDGTIEISPEHYYVHKLGGVFPVFVPEPHWKDFQVRIYAIKEKDSDLLKEANPRRRIYDGYKRLHR